MEEDGSTARRSSSFRRRRHPNHLRQGRTKNCPSVPKPNTWGNVTMPIVGNMGYLLYILLAIFGGSAAISGLGNFGLSGTGPLTLGTLISLLTLSRSFVNQRFQEVSMQFNMVMMALAGASRIFALMDEQPEDDGGSVTLVNVELGEDGRTA